MSKKNKGNKVWKDPDAMEEEVQTVDKVEETTEDVVESAALETTEEAEDIQETVEDKDDAEEVTDEKDEKDDDKNDAEENGADGVFIGTVAFFNSNQKNYGFITPEGKEPDKDDVFVHGKDCEPDASTGKRYIPQAGDKVSYILTPPPANNAKKDLMASQVKLLERAVAKE